MFDWDESYDEVVRDRRIEIYSTDQGVPEGGPHGTRRGTLHGVALRWVGMVALAGGLALAGVVATGYGGALAGSGGASAVVAMQRIAVSLFGRWILTPPDGLMVYGRDQYANFQLAMAGFSDDDLLRYADRTSADLGGVDAAATPFMLDALLLADRELDRRGLARPAAMLRTDALRQSLRSLRAHL